MKYNCVPTVWDLLMKLEYSEVTISWVTFQSNKRCRRIGHSTSSTNTMAKFQKSTNKLPDSTNLGIYSHPYRSSVTYEYLLTLATIALLTSCIQLCHIPLSTHSTPSGYTLPPLSLVVFFNPPLCQQTHCHPAHVWLPVVARYLVVGLLEAVSCKCRIHEMNQQISLWYYNMLPDKLQYNNLLQ